MKSDAGTSRDVTSVKSSHATMLCLVAPTGTDRSSEVIVATGLTGDINDGISRCLSNDHAGIRCRDRARTIDEQRGNAEINCARRPFDPS
jgi:hypothetical protein